MIALDGIALTLSGVAAGVIDVAGAGGSLLSLLVLIASGLPPLTAHSTNRIATPFSFLTVMPDAWRAWRGVGGGVSRTVVLLSIGGTAAGAALLTVANAEVVKDLAPWVLLIATLLIAFPRFFSRWIRLGRGPGTMAGCGVYAGIVGPGVGTLLLAALGTDKQAMRTKNVINLATSITAAVVVLIAVPSRPELVAWPAVALVAGGKIIGGVLGHQLLTRLSSRVLRHIAVATSGVSVAWLFVQ